MQPFDLKRAIAGDPVVTRAGFPVTNIMVCDCPDEFRVIGYAKILGIAQWTESGLYMTSRVESCNDLFMDEPSVDVTADLVKALSDALSLLHCYRDNRSSDLDEDEVIASCEAALELAKKESK